jgi:hypothetical protein
VYEVIPGSKCVFENQAEHRSRGTKPNALQVGCRLLLMDLTRDRGTTVVVTKVCGSAVMVVTLDHL